MEVYSQFFGDEESGQVRRYLHESLMRAVHFLIRTRAQPRTSSTVLLIHRPGETTNTETIEGGTVRGATA